MKKLSIFVFVMSIFVCQSLYAATILVPQDQPTIQAGIDAAVNGDTVLVDDGTYTGAGNVNLNFNGKAITVKSANGVAMTIIDCQNTSDTRGVIFQSGETASSVLDGFTIKNANVDLNSPFFGKGGGIYCLFSSPTITNCIITGNTVGNAGGGIYADQSSPTITNNVITGNSATAGGCGISCFQSSSTITNNTITGNFGSGAGGGGISCVQSSLTIANNTIADNSVQFAGGIIC